MNLHAKFRTGPHGKGCEERGDKGTRELRKILPGHPSVFPSITLESFASDHVKIIRWNIRLPALSVKPDAIWISLGLLQSGGAIAETRVHGPK